MKTLLCPLFILLAVTGSGFAQTISVTASTAGGANCAFTASSYSDGFTANGVGNAPPFTLVKSLDMCSSGLLRSLPGTLLPTVTVRVTALVGGVAKPIRTITLFGVLVSSLTDDTSLANSSGLPSETVTLAYQKIQIQDLINNTSTTCTLSSGICS